jgi:hypothetical protein
MVLLVLVESLVDLEILRTMPTPLAVLMVVDSPLVVIPANMPLRVVPVLYPLTTLLVRSSYEKVIRWWGEI